MLNIAMRTNAENFWRFGHENANIVQHGGFDHKIGVDAKFGVAADQLQRFVANRLAMSHECVVECRARQIITRDYAENIIHELGIRSEE